MEKVFKIFERKLEEAILYDLKKLLSLINGEKLYGIAFITDTFLERVILALNSEESLIREIEKYEERFSNVSLKEKRLFRWKPLNWHYRIDNIQHPKLMEINQYLMNKDIEDFHSFEMLFYESLINILKKIDERALLSDFYNREDVTIFITISGDFREEVFENYSASELNSKKQFEVFKNRYNYSNVN